MKSIIAVFSTWSGLAIGIYISLWIGVTLRYCRPLAVRRNQIRAKILKCWQKQYKQLDTLFSNVYVEDLRVVGRVGDKESKWTFLIKLAFFLSSITLLLSCTAISASDGKFLENNPAFLVAVFCISAIQAVTATLVFSFLFFEYHYYKTLENLEIIADSQNEAEQGAAANP